ncbi:MAG: hypothetical protein LUC97_02090, partial [Clostridiales bacterium]|nr:hypothetical protein [Clostridiales bacterium]
MARFELEKIKAETTASNRSEKVSHKAAGLTTEIENFKKLNPEIENFKTKVNDAEISVQGLLDELNKVSNSFLDFIKTDKRFCGYYD